MSDKIIGPMRPPGLNPRPPKDEEEDVYGPPLPPSFYKPKTSPKHVSDDDEPLIGPLPPSAEDQISPSQEIIKQIEKRSKQMKDKLNGLNAPKKLEREEWMLELPSATQAFGLGPRKFRKNAKELGDRSVWTDTPGDKERKAKLKSVEKPAAFKPYESRDKEIEENMKEYIKEFKQESLLSIHEKKLKRKHKEEKKEEDPTIRRPFDRETDLQVNRFDNAAKKRMIKQSAELSSRFSYGEQSSKFL